MDVYSDNDNEIQLGDDDEENELTIEDKRRLNILRNREFMQQIGLEGASKLLTIDNEAKELKKLEKKPKEIIPKGEERRSSRIILKPKVNYTEKKQKYNKVERRKLNDYDYDDGDGDEDFEWRGSQRRSSKSPRNKYKLRIHKDVDYSLLDVFEFDDSDHNTEILGNKKRAVNKESVQSNQRKRLKGNEGSESEDDSDYDSGEEETENQKTNTDPNKNKGKSNEDNDNDNNNDKSNNGNGSDSESTTSGSSDYTENNNNNNNNNNSTTTPNGSMRRSSRRESTSSSSQTPIKQIVSMNNVSTRQNPHDTPIVMFTGVDDFEKWKTVVISLGGEVEEKEITRITHLVVNCVKTTEKFLGCISRSPPPKIMDLRWLAASLRTRQFVDEKKFLLKDRENEEKYDFKLSEALARSQKKPLFKGTKIYVSSESVDKMMSLSKAIKMAEGTTIFSVPTLYSLSKIGNNFYVICDTEDFEEVKHIHSSHIKKTKWVVESLLTQTLLGVSDDNNSSNSNNNKGNEDSSVDSDN